MLSSLLTAGPFIFALVALGLVIAITIHEFAHAWAADQLGDPTPRMQGRVTLNPLAHLDPLGTLALLLAGFGWGKPVEFDPYNFKHRTRDSALVAFAGPASNIILATVLALCIRGFGLGQDILGFALAIIVQINITLAVFNMVPVAPLDGEKILYALLPKEIGYEYRQFMRQYGVFVLILLIFPIVGGASPVSQLISPIISTIQQLLLG